MDDSPYFSPYADTTVHSRHLPHWQQGDVWCFVTWRLDDALPKEKLNAWKNERDAWLARNPEPWDDSTEAAYHDRFSHRIEAWLDHGRGGCILRDPANAKIIADALLHFDGDRYVIGAFVVMPNHVHVLFKPQNGHHLTDIVKSWKGFTAHSINRRLTKTGSLWQEEYWDRLIRSPAHLLRCAAYIRNNPTAAMLRQNEYICSDKLTTPDNYRCT